MRLRVKQARPVSLNDAVRHAVELEAFNRAERKHIEGQGYMRNASEKVSEQNTSIEEELKALTKVVSDLGKSVEILKKQKPRQSNLPRNSKDNVDKQKRTCYKCGSENHFIAKCPDMKRDKNKVNLQGGHQAKSIAGRSSGLYANCRINNYQTDCLVDTGATLSLISYKTWNIINQSLCLLKNFILKYFTASGNEVEVKGKTAVMIEICDVHWQICLIYLDDIIVIGRTFEDMINNLDKVLTKLRDAGLKLKSRKMSVICQGGGVSGTYYIT